MARRGAATVGGTDAPPADAHEQPPSEALHTLPGGVKLVAPDAACLDALLGAFLKRRAAALEVKGVQHCPIHKKARLQDVLVRPRLLLFLVVALTVWCVCVAGPLAAVPHKQRDS